MKLTLATFVFCISLVGSRAQQVNTPDGPIRGVIQQTHTGKTYYAYYSIPYAKPPVGSKRFLASEPIDSWTEVYDGTAEILKICFQLYNDFPQEDEDCLHLNVYTPLPPGSSEKLPVMVNIHGGGFISGSGLESWGSSPKNILEKDVLFVTFNYRLGAFGFLSTGDDVIPGNAGLSDQILALKWVQRNIAAFGGDPDRVTIFGQSAGGASVGYLILSPAAKGLYYGAILESGSALSAWAYQRNHTSIAYKTGSFIDPQFDNLKDSKKLLEALQNADAKKIDAAALSFATWDSSQPGTAQRSQLQQGFYYAPVTDSASSDPILPEYQYEALDNGDFNRVPILIGTCAEEGLMNIDQWLPYLLRAYDQDSAYLNPQDMHISDEETWNEVGNLIKQRYSPSSLFIDNELGAIRYFTDQDFVKSSTKYAELQSKFTDVYYYQFAYSGKMGGNVDHKLPGSENVTHTEEWGYIFNANPPSNYPESDQLIQRRIIEIWTNFAISRNPTPKPQELLQNLTWPKVTSSNFQFANIGKFENTDLVIVQGKPKADRIAFWDSLYEQYGNRPFDSY